MSTYARPPEGSEIPHRELVTLLCFVRTGSQKVAARELGISVSTCKQRISRILSRTGSKNAAQAAWRLRTKLEKLS